MTGLMMKDALVMRKTLRLYALFLLFYSGLAVLGVFPMSMALAMVEVIVMVLPISSFSYDEAAKWDRYAAVLPVGRTAVVKARYLFLLLVLLAAAALSFFAGGGQDWLDTAIILLIVVFNTVISVSQEDSARKALEALEKLAAPRARVLREGVERRLESTHLVPGDILLLEAGDYVPADGRILWAAGLQTDESAMTGESLPVHKRAGDGLPPDTPLAERKNMVIGGTVVTGGRAKVVVTATGMQTEMGKIAGLGVAPFIMQSTESLVTVVLNTGMQTYGGDLYVGSITIMQSIMQMIVMPVQGITQGTQPIMSYNYGAQNFRRVRQTFKRLLTITLSVTCAAFLVIAVFPGLLARIFTPQPQLIGLVSRVMPLFFGGIWAFGAQMACQTTFMALGQARTSLFLALLRKVILLVPLALILPRVTGSVFGIYAAEPIADVLASATTLTLFLTRRKKLLPVEE